MVLHKVRIVFVATLMAMAVDRASAATAIEYGLISALGLQVPEGEITRDGRSVSATRALP